MYHQANPNINNSHISNGGQYSYGIPPPPYGGVSKPLGPPVGSGSMGKSTSAPSNPLPPPPTYNSAHNYTNGSNLNGSSGIKPTAGMNTSSTTGASGATMNGSNGIHTKPTMAGAGPNINKEQEKLIFQKQQEILMSTREVKLYNDNPEKEMYENLTELYSIIRVTEYLEKLYIRDDIAPKEYTTTCSKLIAQFKTSQSLVKDQFSDISSFMQDYGLNCKAAYERLVNKGFPATLEHTTHSDEKNDGAMAKNVAEAVQTFITTMDSIRLKMVAVDNIYPLLSDLMECLNRNTWLPKSFEGKEKIMNWISVLNRMKAGDELDDDQSRQLLFDLESSYNVFYKAIKN